MIQTDIKDGIVHTYSDEGKKIRPKGAKVPVVNNAFEEEGKEREWVETDEYVIEHSAFAEESPNELEPEAVQPEEPKEEEE